MISVVGLLLAGYAVYVAKSSNKVYTIGINRLTESFTQQLEKTTLDNKQRAAYMLNFAENLEKTISAFHENGTIILMEESVVAGGEDLTAKIGAEIQKALKK